MVSQLSTEAEVEETLNEKFAGEKWEMETFEGKEIWIEVSTINVRPRVNLSGVPEPDFVELANGRDEPSQVERARSILFNEWMTKIRFNVIDGEPEDLRPSGLNLWYASHVSSSAVALDERKIVTRSVGISDEYEIYSNKLETQIIYDGSLPTYTEDLEKVIDNIQYIQENMREVATNYLMNLYSTWDDEWGDKQMAKDLVSFLYGDDVNLKCVELEVKRLWDNLPNEDAE